MAEQLRYVTAAVDRSPHLLAIAEALTAKSGRPRNLPFRGFLIACCLHVCIQERNFYRGKIADMIAELTRDQRASLGLRGPISYSQIVRASLKLERAARDGLTIDDPDNPGHSLTLHLDEVMSYICSAAIPAGMITTNGGVFIAGTPEAHYKNLPVPRLQDTRLRRPASTSSTTGCCPSPANH
ncbi:hypothetical protein [Nostocoides vanveenii]|uniref:hypothetical protein n=1 Tax=Nostocoides vanveenii TaxID=330835 RepID=UPI0031D150FD